MLQIGYVEMPITANSLFSIPKETLLRPISFAFILLAYDLLLFERQPAEKGLLECRKKQYLPHILICINLPLMAYKSLTQNYQKFEKNQNFSILMLKKTLQVKK